MADTKTKATVGIVNEEAQAENTTPAAMWPRLRPAGPCRYFWL